ncbi:MAG: redox-regulated ATPase YchF [Candidatus Bathyarchaeota archaeon]
MPTLGIAGKPNVGKSTFFSAATLAPVPIANYPFTTKTANFGIAYVRVPCVCKEFNVKDNPANSVCLDGTRLIPIKLIDCPGLVPGAWQGRGLGNQFLDEVRKADAILLIVDASGSTDREGRSCKPEDKDLVEDVNFLEEEFDMWLLQIIKKDWDKVTRRMGATKESLDELLLEKLAGLQIKRNHIVQTINSLHLENKNPATWTADEILAFVKKLRKISKPILIVANKMDVPPANENLKKLREKGYEVIPSSAEAELALRRAAEKNLVEYRPGDSDFKISKPDQINERQKTALNVIREKALLSYGSTGVQDALNFAYMKLLNMIPVFPVENVEKLCDHKGRVLPDCYLIPNGTTAKEFASLIHSELSETFIYAIDARGKKRIGEDYVLKSGDVVKIVAAKQRG